MSGVSAYGRSETERGVGYIFARPVDENVAPAQF
jgi:hypothetical protein